MKLTPALIAPHARAVDQPSLTRPTFHLRDGLAALAILGASVPGSVRAAEPDLQTLNRIADSASNHSEIAETAAYLTDMIGGRLPNSPAMRSAESWTQSRFRGWGLNNVNTQGFHFGRGWSIESATTRMFSPRPMVLRSIPLAWTPPTQGALTAPIIVAPMASERDFETWAGKLKGRIVLVSFPEAPVDPDTPAFKRLSNQDLANLDTYAIPEHNHDSDAKRLRNELFTRRLDAFLAQQGAVAWARMARRDGGVVHGDVSWGWQVGQTPALPAVEISAEDYRRLARLAKKGPVTLEIDNRVRFHDDDHNAYNVLAEIPGTDRGAGYVMAGAHLDSWVAADGAADNAAGSAVVMEAARILSAMKVKPKRTIVFALWNAEEQVYGSYPYADEFVAQRPEETNPDRLLARRNQSRPYPVNPLAGYDQLAAYFNLDNGSGKIRGIYAEGNFAAVPILKSWLKPFTSLGGDTVVARSTTGTDHVPFARIGLPAFQFIQDPLNYSTQVHHTSLDTFDQLRIDDLKKSALIMAWVLLSAANHKQPLPRNVIPTEPKPTNPFSYEGSRPQ